MKNCCFILNCKAFKCLAVLVTINFGCFCQNLVTVNNCISNSPVHRVYAISDNILVGVSNQQGIIEYDEKWEDSKVVIHKFGFKDSLIRLTRGSAYCIHEISFLIKEVQISVKQLSPAEQLKKLLNKNIQLFNLQRDSAYFKFRQSIVIPEKRWNEKIVGNIILVSNPYNSSSSGIWNSFYCNLNVEVDSAFWHNQNKKKFLDHFPIGSFTNEGIRKGQILRKRNLHKFKIQKNYNENDVVFSFVEEKNSKIHRYQVTFSNDSLIKEFVHEIEVIEGKKAVRLGGEKYDFWRVQFNYAFRNNIFMNQFQFNFKTYSKNGIAYQLDASGERINTNNKERECKEVTIFMNYHPKAFKKNGFSVKYR